jgi:protein phosphatase 1G
MGSYLDKPVIEKLSESGSGNGLTWGSSAMQGWRTNMEDAHITIPVLEGDLSSMSLFGVFDGHGGKEVALFCRDKVPQVFVESMAKGGGNDGSGSNGIAQALVRTFHKMDDMLRLPEYYNKAFLKHAERSSSSKPRVIEMMEEKLKDRVEADMAEARKKGSIERGEAERLGARMNMLKKLGSLTMEGNNEPQNADGPASSTGCTAVCIVLTPREIICGNAGDSRAVLCRSGAAVDLSSDHKPEKESERSRIEKAGGSVEAQQKATPGARTVYRVRPGGLSLSRAIGDLQGKTRPDLSPSEQVISATPEMHIELRNPDDEFIVIACDGIWDVKSSSEVCYFVRKRILKGMPIPTIIEQLFEECICKDPKESYGIGGDNMTCVIVQLQVVQTFADRDSGRPTCFPWPSWLCRKNSK